MPVAATELAPLRERRLSVSECDGLPRSNRSVNGAVKHLSLRASADILAEAARADARWPKACARAAVGCDRHQGFGVTKGRTTFGSRIFADSCRTRTATSSTLRRPAPTSSQDHRARIRLRLRPPRGVRRDAHCLDQRLTSADQWWAAVAVALNCCRWPMAATCAARSQPGRMTHLGFARRRAGWRPAVQRAFLSQMGVKVRMARNVADLGRMSGAAVTIRARRSRSMMVCVVGRTAVGQTELARRVARRSRRALPVEPVCRSMRGGARTREAGISKRARYRFRLRGGVAGLRTLRNEPAARRLKSTTTTRSSGLLKPETVWEIEGALGLTAPKI